MFKEERGITLVALVVTIIVLLILAGVTITLALGSNGVIGRAQEASNTGQMQQRMNKLLWLKVKHMLTMLFNNM